MSGGGGFYKYRCKYFYTHDCPNWVYVNNTACATCSSNGRDAEPAPQARVSTTMATGYSREICVPRVEGGVLYYTLMAIPTDAAGNYWALKIRESQQQTQPPTVPTTTSALPGAVIATTSF
ncbi:hypothetical protein F5Y16DRAFT_189841 [Xylariaceae sp. FL0255]|nr:hypothetical protein F5Y16DRAFT_189841 [Xylariaceae sp. FL0255]